MHFHNKMQYVLAHLMFIISAKVYFVSSWKKYLSLN